MPINVVVYYHKKTAGLQFDVDTRPLYIRNKGIKVNLYRNMNKSKFVEMFVNTASIKEPGSDVHCKYEGLKDIHTGLVYNFTKEKLDLNAGKSKSSPNNYVLVLGFKIVNLDNDYNFFFVQRRCYSNDQKNCIIRTAGIQIASPDGFEAFSNMSTAYDNNLLLSEKSKETEPEEDTYTGEED
jgi:hypothetical protein